MTFAVKRADNTRQILEGNLLRAMLSIAVPVVVNSFLQTLYNLTDTYWLGQIGKEPLAAINLVTPVQNIVIGFGGGLTVATAVMVSQYIGARMQTEARRMANQIFACAMGFSLLCAGALAAVTQVCLPYIGQGGCIMNVCSIAAFLPLPYMNVYSATKVFALHYSLALRRELCQAGVNVTAVCPGWMDTAFLDRAREGVGHMVTRYAGITTPERVARKALRDARRGRSRSLCGVFSHLTFWASRLLPRSLVTRFWLMQQHLS